MNTIISSVMHKKLFIIVSVVILIGTGNSLVLGECIIEWVGDESGSIITQETSRTLEAARQLERALLPAGPGFIVEDCGDGDDPEFPHCPGCRATKPGWLVDVCLDGSYTKKCLYSNPECGWTHYGTWDVVCESTTTTTISETTTTTTVPIITPNYWARTYGGSQDDYSYAFAATSDGGGVVAGYTESFGVGYRDVWALKLDNQGNISWQKRYGGSGLDAAYSILQNADGSYIVQGYTGSYGAGSFDILLLKLDSSGNIMWQKAYGGPNFERGYSIKQTLDNGYVIAGYTGTDGSAEGSSNDILVLKVDGNGNLSWMKTYGGSQGDHVKSITATSDGGYLVTGFTESFGAGGRDLFVLKLDGSGDVTWMKTYGTSGNDVSYANGLENEDGSYMVAGATNSFGAGDFDFWLLKLDSNGNIIWQKTYGGIKRDVATALKQTTDGGYVLTGQTASFGVGVYDTLLLKLDSDGTIIWQKNYGGTGDGHAFAIHESTNGSFILAGYENSSGAGGYDYCVMKVDSFGDIPDCSIVGTSNAVMTPSNVSPITVNISAVSFPNPVTTVTYFSPVNTFVSAFNFCGEATLISLSSFTASPANKAVIVKWQTESEIDNVGFNLYRCTTETGEYIKINTELIPAKGSATQGAGYEFIDKNVRNRKTYWYKLEDIDINGVSTLHGPIKVTPRIIHRLFQ